VLWLPPDMLVEDEGAFDAEVVAEFAEVAKVLEGVEVA